MSDAVSALQGARFDGYVRVEEAGLRGMITLRGDPASAPVRKAATGAAGVDMPGQRQAQVNGDCGIAWMSPDELLVMVPYAEVDEKLAGIEKMLKGKHYLAVNVSDARAVFRLAGKAVREVVAKLAPVDMSPDAFGIGDFRRTRFAQVPAAFWMPDDQTVEIICFRSVAEYMFNILKDAATQGGEVGAFG